MLVYYVSRPGENGELSALHKWLRRVSDYRDEWETKNHLMTAALEQASRDKHLLYTAERSKNFELTYPEYVAIDAPFFPGRARRARICSGDGLDRSS